MPRYLVSYHIHGTIRVTADDDRDALDDAYDQLMDDPYDVVRGVQLSAREIGDDAN